MSENKVLSISEEKKIGVKLGYLDELEPILGSIIKWSVWEIIYEALCIYRSFLHYRLQHPDATIILIDIRKP